MDAHTELGNKPKERPTRRARGRTQPDKQEKVINLDELRDRIAELTKLYTKAKEVGKDFSNAVKKCAEKSGLNASAVRQFIIAKAGDNFDDKKKQVEQLALCFEEAEK